jgi:hypothetical protein
MDGPRKRKQGFALTDPDNAEVQRQADIAARKKARVDAKSQSASAGQKAIRQGGSSAKASAKSTQGVANPTHRHQSATVEDEPEETSVRNIAPRNPNTIVISADEDELDAPRPKKKPSKASQKVVVTESDESEEEVEKEKEVPEEPEETEDAELGK